MRELTMNEVQDVNGALLTGIIGGLISTAMWETGKGFVNAVQSCSGYADPSDVHTSGGWVG
jgi:hypothetical protein